MRPAYSQSLHKQETHTLAFAQTPQFCPPCPQVPAFESAEDFLQHVAAVRGKLRRGGTVDMAAAARIVLTDWNDGRIPFYTEPPTRDSGGHAGATIVQNFSVDFSADEVSRASALIPEADPSTYGEISNPDVP